MSLVSSGRGPVVPLSPLSARSALLFIDLGYLRHRGTEMFGRDISIDPTGIGRLISRGTVSQGPFSSTMLRAYVYDAKPNSTDPQAPESGAAEEGQPSPLHEALAATDQVIMRYGRMLQGKQKGVDTRLVLDMTKYAWTGVCQVVHVMTGDTDFEEPIREVSELGVQVVMYEFEDAAQSLHDRLRFAADRVISVDRSSAADLFTVPRFRFVGRTGSQREASDWFTQIANEGGWFEYESGHEAAIEVLIGRNSRPESGLPCVRVSSDGQRISVNVTPLVLDSADRRFHDDAAVNALSKFLKDHGTSPGEPIQRRL